MSDKKISKYLSKKERERFDALAKYTTVKQAASDLGVTESTMHNWTSKLRKRLLKERGHLNACLAQRKRSPLLDKVLRVRRPIKAAAQEEDDEE